MISICVKGRFSRFFALPLFRRPSPNSTEFCDEGNESAIVGCRSATRVAKTTNDEASGTRAIEARESARALAIGDGAEIAQQSRFLATRRAVDIPGSPVSPTRGGGGDEKSKDTSASSKK